MVSLKLMFNDNSVVCVSYWVTLNEIHEIFRWLSLDFCNRENTALYLSSIQWSLDIPLLSLLQWRRYLVDPRNALAKMIDSIRSFLFQASIISPEYHFLQGTKSTGAYRSMISDQRSSSLWSRWTYLFSASADNEVFHYLSSVGSCRRASISSQCQSMRATKTTKDECKPKAPRSAHCRSYSNSFLTLLHKALHGIVYNRPEYEPQTQISS